MKAQELRDLSIDELMAKQVEVKVELFELVNELKVSKKLEKPHLVPQLRRDIARIKTIINQKKMVKA